MVFKDKEMDVFIGNLSFATSYFSKSGNKEEISEKIDISSLPSQIFNDKIKDILYLCQKKRLLVVFVIVNHEIVGLFSINTYTNLRHEARGVIKFLKRDFGIDSFILSGDAVDSVIEAGKSLNISEQRCLGGKSAKAKRIILNNLKENGTKRVSMMGDGLNDCLSLAEADYGISFNASNQLNVISSDVIFVKEDLSLFFTLLKLSKYTNIFIWINLFWAFAYNIVMIPIATGFLTKYVGFELNPITSSIAQLVSDLLIIATSFVLRFFSFDDHKKRKALKTFKEINSEKNQEKADKMRSSDDDDESIYLLKY